LPNGLGRANALKNSIPWLAVSKPKKEGLETAGAEDGRHGGNILGSRKERLGPWGEGKLGEGGEIWKYNRVGGYPCRKGSASSLIPAVLLEKNP